MNVMNRDTNLLIAELVDDLRPVRPLSLWRGLGVVVASMAAMIAGVAMVVGLRPDLLTGSPDPLFLLANGLFLLLGLAASVSVLAMGRPRVGSDHSGWAWATAMAALLPATGIALALAGKTSALTGKAAGHGLDCLMMGSALGLLAFAVLVIWLRRGAPTSPERAGLVAGIAAGSLGTFAYSLHCAFNDIVHIGLWHGGVVALSALAGRMVVPRLIRW